MEGGKFSKEAITDGHPKWNECIRRENNLYDRPDDVRSPFARDYNRILHCTAYRRLKHKTQVFFATGNDHICTRIEHVNHVASVSYTISNYLGLNTELTNAIAVGHDLGHAPFGHTGEEILKRIAEQELQDSFWHEKNSLCFVDKYETLPGPDGREWNLNLTYAVRDGIILHCGEVDDMVLKPRNYVIKLEDITEVNQHMPFTWEGCLVKVADKIAYWGRDIEDALSLRILDDNQKKELIDLVEDSIKEKISEFNNTFIMHKFIIDICNTSDPNDGIRLSPNYFELMKRLRDFSTKHIYKHKRLEIYKQYAKLIIESIYSVLKEAYRGEDTINELNLRYSEIYPLLTKYFVEWLKKYSKNIRGYEREGKYKNDIIYDMKNYMNYLQAIIDFISGMTDSFAVKVFNELTSF